MDKTTYCEARNRSGQICTLPPEHEGQHNWLPPLDVVDDRAETWGCKDGCIYSRSMHQPYPRRCVKCGQLEINAAPADRMKR